MSFANGSDDHLSLLHSLFLSLSGYQLMRTEDPIQRLLTVARQPLIGHKAHAIYQLKLYQMKSSVKGSCS